MSSKFVFKKKSSITSDQQKRAQPTLGTYFAKKISTDSCDELPAPRKDDADLPYSISSNLNITTHRESAHIPNSELSSDDWESQDEFELPPKKHNTSRGSEKDNENPGKVTSWEKESLTPSPADSDQVITNRSGRQRNVIQSDEEDNDKVNVTQNSSCSDVKEEQAHKECNLKNSTLVANPDDDIITRGWKKPRNIIASDDEDDLEKIGGVEQTSLKQETPSPHCTSINNLEQGSSGSEQNY